MERHIKRFSSMAALRYFGVLNRPNDDDNQQEGLTVGGTQNEEFEELQFDHPHIQQLMPPPCQNEVEISSDEVWSEVTWSKINPVYEPDNDVVQPRHGHKAVAYEQLMIVFSGGNEDIIDEVNVYCTATNRWFKPLLGGEIPPGKASYGAAIYGHRLLIYGGMEEERRFSDTLYECNLETWEWKLLKPCGRTPAEIPTASNGHSFTEIYGRIFMFGGVGRDDTGWNLIYSNDLYILYPWRNEQQGLWEKPTTFGNPPLPRESHAAVTYVSKDSGDTKLVIFGGRRFDVRFGDIHSLDVNTMMWTEIEASFTPRSLHTATLVRDKVYIFGGWISVGSEKRLSDGDDQLMCFNLASMSWEMVCRGHVGTNENPGTLTLSPVPLARTGHSAVAIDEKIYVWSGRYGFERGKDRRQICLDDFWMLDVLSGQVPPVNLPQITAQQIIPDEQIPIPVDLSLVKNERLSPEPVDLSLVKNERLSPEPQDLSRLDVAKVIMGIEKQFTQRKEQQSQSPGASQTQELGAASETGQTNGIPEQTQAINVASTSASSLPSAEESNLQSEIPNFSLSRKRRRTNINGSFGTIPFNLTHKSP